MAQRITGYADLWHGSLQHGSFARVGGGIFTKAADVGADLVGKVEAVSRKTIPAIRLSLPTMSGMWDVAGMGADLYESYIGSILSTCALAAAAGYGFAGVAVPMIMAVLGMFASLIGSFFRHDQGGRHPEIPG